MKKALLIAACLGFASLAFADAMYDAQPASFMKVTSANYEVEPGKDFKSTIHVTAMVEFSNACVAPTTEKEVIVAVQANDTHTTYNHTLLQLKDNRVCAAIISPVSKMVHVGHVHVTGGMGGLTLVPAIYVNGVLAKNLGSN